MILTNIECIFTQNIDDSDITLTNIDAYVIIQVIIVLIVIFITHR